MIRLFNNDICEWREFASEADVPKGMWTRTDGRRFVPTPAPIAEASQPASQTPEPVKRASARKRKLEA